MQFNSIEFAIFLPLVFLFYWLVINKNYKHQNILVIFASYVFYGWWDWRFLSLIIFSTLIDYFVGLKLEKANEQKIRKLLLLLSLVVNLGLLGVFKYYNFFIDSFYDLIPGMKYVLGFNTLSIILPVGISFYTFQTMSYTIDVYRKKIAATTDLTSFAAYVSFFPQLVAGPIERATNLLPQFQKNRKFEYSNAVDGFRQILWGLFKKVVIADNCAQYANVIFNNSAEYSGSTLVIGAIFFTFQIYGDFSGYSDIAIGTARLFGFNLMQNFAFPYFSRDIAEFWRRWHISLSTWFRDYLYIPLGGSRGSKYKIIRNTFIIFIVSGFWHGANWTFIIWGALNAIYFLPLMLTGQNRKNMEIVAENSFLPSIREILQMGTTFIITVFAWIFFRAENLSHAFNYISAIFTKSIIAIPDFPGRRESLNIIILVIVFLFIEWLGRRDKYAIEKILTGLPAVVRWIFYYLIIVAVFWFTGQEQQFIYFQF